MAFSLLVNSVDILASAAQPDATGELVEFSRSYEEPASLTFRVFSPAWEPPFGADATVLLYRDGVLVFEGLTGLPRSIIGVGKYPAVEYIARDYSDLMRRGTVLGEDEYTSVQLAPGSLGSVAGQLIDLVGEDIAGDRIKLQAKVEYRGGAEAIECFPVTLEGESIDEAMRKIAASAPGVGVVMLPGEQPNESLYTFVNLYASPGYTVDIETVFVGDLTVEQSLEGRAGAVSTIRGETVGQVDVEYDEVEELTPDWTEAEQRAWKWEDAFERNVDGERFSPRVHVHRRFKYSNPAITEESPMAADVETVPTTEPSIWQRVAVESIDIENQTITLVLPAITKLKQNNASRNNPFHPGKCKPARVKLRYSISGTGSLPISIAAHRVPSDGFAGRAYQLAPRTCGYVKVITVPDGVSKEQYAADAFRAFSEPTVFGSIPLNDDLPADLWMLDRRINIASPSIATTGFEAMMAPMRGVRVNFDGGGSASIEFNRDDAELLGEGGR